jgi:ABC-type uncharacterized transport system permease subunit
MTEAVYISIFSIGIGLMAPILWAALGELVTEQAGVLNVGIEGVMLIGAFAAAIGNRYAGGLVPGVFIGAAAGGLCGLVLAYLFVSRGADQIVTGILFTLFALGLTTVIYAKWLGGGQASTLPEVHIPALEDIPALGPILFQQRALVYIAIAFVPIVFYLMRRTWFGLYSRAVAENPRAAETAGLNVVRLRYPAVIFGCMLVGVGGATLVANTSGQFVLGMTNGRGFIALAVVVLAAWNPFWAVGACLLFGTAQALQLQVDRIGGLGQVPDDFWLMLPYVITIVAVVFARATRYPAAVGVPYRRAGTTKH